MWYEGYTLCSAQGGRSFEPVGLSCCVLCCCQQSERQWEIGHQKPAKSDYTTEEQNWGTVHPPIKSCWGDGGRCSLLACLYMEAGPSKVLLYDCAVVSQECAQKALLVGSHNLSFRAFIETVASSHEPGLSLKRPVTQVVLYMWAFSTNIILKAFFVLFPCNSFSCHKNEQGLDCLCEPKGGWPTVKVYLSEERLATRD